MEKEVDLDDVLEEIGQFGKHQILIIMLMSAPIIFNGMGVNEYVFSAADLNYRCHIPECEGDSINHENFDVPWFDNAIPSRCERYAPTNNVINPPADGTCPANVFNTSARLRCEDFVYERTNTIVYDFDINCQDWMRTLVGTMRSVGTLVVQPITGFLSDKFGRRTALTINAINRGVIGFTRSFSVNYEMFLALSFLESAVSAGAFPCAYVYATELVGPKWRTLAGVTMSAYFAIGQAICGLVAWGFPEWRIFTRVLYGPHLIVFIYFWILPESVRWLLSKKKYRQAEIILKKAAKRNGRELSQKSSEALENSVRNTTKNADNTISFGQLLKKTFKSRTIIKRLMIVPFWWVTSTLVYYGLTINSVGLDESIYLNFILVSLIEIPGYYTAAFTLNIFGRKKSLFVSFVSCGLACFAFPFIPQDLSWLRTLLYLLGKFFISMTITSIYIYTTELFPTQMRQSYLAFSSMVGRIGSIVAPQTPLLIAIWTPLPMIIFGAFAVTAGLLVLLTPETNGTKLPDTIEEAEHMERMKVTEV